MTALCPCCRRFHAERLRAAADVLADQSADQFDVAIATDVAAEAMVALLPGPNGGSGQ